ncbi:MAG: M48 family metallopeptidase [Chitinophagales bacterium]|nr:M48 family metallopeptidase [Chitinophagales bacterium]
MKKVIIQGLITVALFLAIWVTFQQVNWMKIFKVNDAKENIESQLGNFFWKYFKENNEDNNDTFATKTLDSLVNIICQSNDIDTSNIKLHLLNSNEVNAFALPDGHLVIYTGLIEKCDKPEELCGVLAHELAHIQLNHIMKKLLKEMGLTVLTSVTTGNAGNQTVKEVAKLISSTAFDRNLEKEADINSVNYLINAKINPAPFADLMYKLSIETDGNLKYLTWLSTHPASEERANYIIDLIKEKGTQDYETVISNKDWNTLKANLSSSVITIED